MLGNSVAGAGRRSPTKPRRLSTRWWEDISEEDKRVLIQATVEQGTVGKGSPLPLKIVATDPHTPRDVCTFCDPPPGCLPRPDQAGATLRQ